MQYYNFHHDIANSNSCCLIIPNYSFYSRPVVFIAKCDDSHAKSCVSLHDHFIHSEMAVEKQWLALQSKVSIAKRCFSFPKTRRQPRKTIFCCQNIFSQRTRACKIVFFIAKLCFHCKTVFSFQMNATRAMQPFFVHSKTCLFTMTSHLLVTSQSYCFAANSRLHNFVFHCQMMFSLRSLFFLLKRMRREPRKITLFIPRPLFNNGIALAKSCVSSQMVVCTTVF